METGSKSMETEGKSGRALDMPTEELRRLLKDINFPANKHEIVDKLRKSGISPGILEDVISLPDKEYSSADEVIQGFKKEA